MNLSPEMLERAPVEKKQEWLARIRWRLIAHRFQIPPPGSWRGWMMQAGRGSGKTRTGAQDAVEYSLDHPRHRYAVVAPTQGDCRAICFEGESGILAVLESMGLIPERDFSWQKSSLELELPNGSLLAGYSAEKPDRLRGPQFHRAWLDELAAWRDAHLGDALNTTFNNLGMGLRLGADARMVITTTPKRVALIRELVARDDMAITHGTTYDNLENLSPTFAAAILRYEGSTIGRQELMGELIEDVEGALWKSDLIDRSRISDPGPTGRVVVGVDPAGSTHNETGIVVAGITSGSCACGDRERLPHAYVLGDWSVASTPDGWGRAVVEAFDSTSADRVIAERNYGGDMVEKIIRSVRPGIPFGFVTASRGKILRAEPIAALYEQNRIHHVGYLRELEEEMTTFTPQDPWSPNRLDALVWALTELGLHKNVEATISSRAASRRV